MTIQQLDGLAEVMADYDAALLDLWGVVHNGVVAHPAALDFIGQARAAGKRVGLLSNGPRRVDSIRATLAKKFGLDPAGYDLLMTSGEDAWLAMDADRTQRKGWLLGTLPLDGSMIEGLDHITWVEDPKDADFCLNTGPQGAEPKVEDYQPLLDDFLARAVPMVCANPDRLVHRGDSLEICAGAIGERFEIMGGEVRWHGKPHRSVYVRCFEAFDNVAPERVLFVGDSFITDVLGASVVGMDCALVTSGLYRDDIAALGVDAAAEKHGAFPRYALPNLAW